ncbi:MAG TPA: hypothetical protein VM711_06240, partial [Sphingomicrobium sp.]|nr:hypothetical protein [Sphingomicrobium sp.]
DKQFPVIPAFCNQFLAAPKRAPAGLQLKQRRDLALGQSSALRQLLGERRAIAEPDGRHCVSHLHLPVPSTFS